MTDGIPGDEIECREYARRPVERLVMRCRELEMDHEPNGWPAIQMRDVTALCSEIDRLRALSDNLLDIAAEAYQRFIDYEMIVDSCAPHHHCDFMRRLRKIIKIINNDLVA